MKRLLQNISINVWLSSITILLVLGTTTMISLYAVMSVKQNAIKESEQKIRQSASRAASRVQNVFNNALNASHIMAQNFDVMREDRSRINSLLQIVLKENPMYVSTFALWEPNEFDLMDTLYQSLPGHDETGRFVPMWTKNTVGLPFMSDIKDFTTIVGEDVLFSSIKKDGQPLMVEPFFLNINGNLLYQTSLVHAIGSQQSFYGITGINLSLEGIQHWSQEEPVFERSVMYLISSNDIVAACSKGAMFRNKPLIEYLNLNYDSYLDGKRRQQTVYVRLSDQHLIFVPVSVIPDKKPWLIVLTTPVESMMKDAQSYVNKLIIISVVSISLCVILLFWFVNRILKPIPNIVKAAKDLSDGKLDISFPVRGVKELRNTQEALLQLSKSLQELNNASDLIYKGNFDIHLVPRSDKDTLAKVVNQMSQSMKKAYDETERTKQEEEARNWRRRGIAELTEVIQRSIGSIEDISYNIVQKIVDYLGISQGGLFIYVERDGKQELRLLATVAYNSRKYHERTVMLGEGLVGACGKEREIIYLTNVPDVYLEVQSGLGEVKPQGLLLAPLITDNKLQGVVELASIRPFTPQEIDYIQRASDSIAAALLTNNINYQTAELLQQSRLQTEQLAQKENAMLQTIEDLKEQLQFQTIAIEQYQAIFAAVDQSALVAEFSPQGTYTNVNQKFVEVLGYNRTQVLDRYHSDFASIAEDILSYREFWADLQANKPKYIEQEYTSALGEKIWLSEHYIPQTDSRGKLLKVWYFSIDITGIRQGREKIQSLMRELDSSRREAKQNQSQNVKLRKELDESKIGSAEQQLLIDKLILYAEIDLQGLFKKVNRNFCRITGYHDNQLIDVSIRTIVADENIQTIEQLLQHRNEGELFTAELKIENAQTGASWLQIASVGIKDKNENINRIMILAIDLTDYRRKNLIAARLLNEVKELREKQLFN